MIYIVEDDANIRELVCYTLTNLVTTTVGFEENESFEFALNEELPDLIILDLMLPKKDGLTILKELREKPETNSIPVLILSAKESEFDKVTGLNLGADDYLAKPFGAMELTARVNALLRRSHFKNFNEIDDITTAIEFGPLKLDQLAHEFLLNNEPINLTRKEYTLLHLFIKNPKSAFSREQLLDLIWGYQYDGESRTLDVHVASLRQKLGKFGNQIETIRGFGYRFNP